MDPAEKQRNYELAEKLLSEQNFGAAVVAGVVAMVLSAGIYGIVKSMSEGFYYSILAAGAGVVIGVTMQYLGRVFGWMFKDLHFADLMFWIVGIGGAAYFARRPLTRAEGLALYIYKSRH